MLLKIERFGNAFTGIPDSAEKSAFRKHFLKKVRELNVEFDEKPNRAFINGVTVATSAAGVGLVLWIGQTGRSGNVNLWSLVLGFVLRLLIGAVNLAATWFINRLASSKAFDKRAEMFIKGEA